MELVPYDVATKRMAETRSSTAESYTQTSSWTDASCTPHLFDMAQNPDPFSFQFGPMTPTGPATSQPEEAAPPLPPRQRLRRRPVPTPGAAASQSPASPTQVPQFRELGSYPSSPSRSPPTYDPSRPDHGYAPIPAVPAQGAASAGSPGVQPTRRHSRFVSAVRKLAKVVFLESISPGLSAALASDNR